MIIDQLDTEFMRAERGFERNDLFEIHCGLKNAQAIVALLRDSLQLDVWEPAKDIYQIYQFSLDLLVKSNLKKERAPFEDAKEILAPLMAAWREAAATATVGSPELATVNG
jgi:flagellar protein FliS